MKKATVGGNEDISEDIMDELDADSNLNSNTDNSKK